MSHLLESKDKRAPPGLSRLEAYWIGGDDLLCGAKDSSEENNVAFEKTRQEANVKDKVSQ